MADGLVTAPVIGVDASVLLPAITGVEDVDADTTSAPSGMAPRASAMSRTVGALGATNDGTYIVGEAPFAGTVTSVSYTPKAAITGANTDTRTLIVINKGQDGNGVTAIAQLTFSDDVDAADYDELELTLTDALANREVATSDMLALRSVHSGGGLADPGGLLQIGISRT